MDETDGRPLTYLDDLKPGDRSVTASLTVDEAEMLAFARRYDPQPFHTDAHAARDSFFAGLAASGWFTAALTMRLLVTGGYRVAWGMIGAGGEIAWPRPTRAGDVLHVENTVLAVEPSKSKPDRGMATIESLTKNQDGEVVQRLVARMLMPRRP